MLRNPSQNKERDYLKLVTLFFLFVCFSGVLSTISPYIKHYEGLSYDRGHFHRMHLRARRTPPSEEYSLKLDFTAFYR